MNKDELNSPTKKKKREIFLKYVKLKIGTSLILPTIAENHSENSIYYEDNEETQIHMPNVKKSIGHNNQVNH